MYTSDATSMTFKTSSGLGTINIEQRRTSLLCSGSIHVVISSGRVVTRPIVNRNVGMGLGC